MKSYIPYSLILAAASCGMAYGAATAYTTPVGYSTTIINGNTAGNPNGADTYVAAALVQPTVFAGQTSSAPSGHVATFSGGVPTTLDATYVLEITSGTNEGYWSTVKESSATTITINDSDNFPEGLPANVNISVRKHNTIATVFGANALGMKAGSNATSPPYDYVQLLNPLDQSITSAIYVLEEIGLGPDGWYDFVTGAPMGDTVIEPGTSVKVVRQDATGLTQVTSGTVKTTKTQVDVFPNYNWLGTSLAAGSTLGAMNLYSQIAKYDNDVHPNDFVVLVNPDQSTTTYVAPDPAFGLGENMIDFVLGTDASTTACEGYVFQRAASLGATVITIPAQTVAP